MRIELNHGLQPTPENNRTNTPASTAASGSATGNVLGEDQAQLSGTHAQVDALAAQAAQLPEVREERVQSLRQAVLSGQYQLSPENVAGAMLSYMTVEPAA